MVLKHYSSSVVFPLIVLSKLVFNIRLIYVGQYFHLMAALSGLLLPYMVWLSYACLCFPLIVVSIFKLTIVSGL